MRKKEESRDKKRMKTKPNPGGKTGIAISSLSDATNYPNSRTILPNRQNEPFYPTAKTNHSTQNARTILLKRQNEPCYPKHPKQKKKKSKTEPSPTPPKPRPTQTRSKPPPHFFSTASTLVPL